MAAKEIKCPRCSHWALVERSRSSSCLLPPDCVELKHRHEENPADDDYVHCKTFEFALARAVSF